MQLGRNDFEVYQLAYIDAYVYGKTEIMAFMMHANFNNVRIGTLKSKLEFIPLVELKIKNNKWYEPQSTYRYRNLAKHTVGETASSYGQLTIRGPSEVLIFNVSDLWLYHPQDAWKILNFSISPFASASSV